MVLMFTEMTDEGLVEAYWTTRRLASDMANARNRRVGRVLRDMDIIVAVARKRGLSLAR
jgi:hypothetical protein